MSGDARRRLGAGFCFGGFGEILQGRGRRLGDFLVTLPIAEGAWARAEPSDRPFVQVRRPEPHREPLWKSTAAVSALMDQLDIPDADRRIDVVVDGRLPVGEGLASSTADCIAALRAVADFYRRPAAAEIVSRILSGVEPHDGLMYESCVAYDHRRGALIEDFGWTPDVRLSSLRLRPPISTLAYNADPPFSEDDADQADAAFAEISKAFADRAAERVFEVSLREARRLARSPTQAVFAPFLDAVDRLAQSQPDAVLGAVICHSGSRAAAVSAWNADADAVERRLSEELGTRRSLRFERFGSATPRRAGAEGPRSARSPRE